MSEHNKCFCENTKGISHPWTFTVAMFNAVHVSWNFSRFRVYVERDVCKRLICLDCFSHPIPTLCRYVILMTLLHSARRRLPSRLSYVIRTRSFATTAVWLFSPNAKLRKKNEKILFCNKNCTRFLCKYRTGSKKVLQTKNRLSSCQLAFLVVLRAPSSCFSSFKASLHFKRTTFGVQRSPNCIAKRLQLQCNSCPFEVKRSFFWSRNLHRKATIDITHCV